MILPPTTALLTTLPASAVAVPDDRYWLALLYMFELVVPPNPPVFRVLLLGPSAYSHKAQFSSDKQIGQWGGVHVYEQGVILGQIQLEIDPGVRPAAKRHDGSAVSTLSGHGRMLDIWQSIILPYSNAKKAPATAAGTKLRLHVQKDRKVFEVIPDTFGFQRAVGKPGQSPYSVTLTVVGEGDDVKEFPATTSDKSLLDLLRDANRAVRSAVQAATSAVQAVTAALGQVRELEQELTGVIGDVQVLLDACTQMISAGTSIIRYPLQAVRNLLLEVDHAASLIVALPGDWHQLQDDWALIGDALDQIAMFPERFTQALGATQARNQAQQTAESSGFHSGANGIRFSGSGERSYTGWVDMVVLASDTPEGLANRYGVPWADIAAANRLRPPYLAPVQLPGCVAPGQRIIVPRYLGGDPAIGAGTRGDVPGADQQADAYGRDFRFDPIEGFALDTSHGSTDSDTISGIPNVAQALGLKLHTVRGANLIWPTLGRQGDVGDAVSIELLALQETFCKQALLQDQRLKEVRRVTVAIAGDTMTTELDAILRDGTEIRALGQLER